MGHEFSKMHKPISPSDPYQIEKMKSIHLPAVLSIEKKSFSQPWSFSLFISELSNRMANYLVLLIEGRVVGYIGMWTFLDEAHITTFAIHPDCRRQGYGKKLFLHALKYAIDQGCLDILLEVRASNLPAQNLYRSLGFGFFGIRKKYYSDGEDALLMKKTSPGENNKLFS